jgi:chemotaxis protein methyltransferase CheR
VATRPAWDIGLALQLLREERFTEALDLVDAFPPESARDAEVLLLQAVLLTHSSQFAKAERTCERLLDVDDLNAGAHYLLALCREGTGDRAGSTHHDQVAMYLDAAFAMPHLHLGLLARRSGDRALARRELGQALVLLQREDASRLLLFGGGFGREALVALCRTEVIASGGKP